jgi:hypothetical protein
VNLLKSILALLTLLFITSIAYAYTGNPAAGEKQLAIKFLDSVDQLPPSKYWPGVNPRYFLQNLKRNVESPLYLYAGRNTNFCAYAALSYILIQQDPQRYARFMIELYNNGKSKYRKEFFNPSEAVKMEAGRIIYEGELDRNHADQVWFLSLADNFKGYINFFNRRYSSGDENKLWASTNLAKFNRMLRRLTGREVHSKGSDLIRPSIKDLPGYLKERLSNYDVYLYLNNTMLRKKNHNKLKKKIPTHYVVLLSMTEENNEITFTYWDAAFKTLRKVPVKTLKKILYGVTWVERK